MPKAPTELSGFEGGLEFISLTLIAFIISI